MPFITGGLLEEWGPARESLLEVQRQIRDFNGRKAEDEYVVDVAFRTWHNFREPRGAIRYLRQFRMTAAHAICGNSVRSVTRAATS